MVPVDAVQAAECLMQVIKRSGASSLTVLIKNADTGQSVCCVVATIQPEAADLLNEFGDMLTEKRS